MPEQLVVDGMKFSVCNPSFLDMRDAILMADRVRYAGQHQCLLWENFAQGGQGFFAEDNTAGDLGVPIEDFTLPPFCDPTNGIGSVGWQFAEIGCDATAVIRVSDADLVLPADVVVTSVAGDSETLALRAAPAGAPQFVTDPFPVVAAAVTTEDGTARNLDARSIYPCRAGLSGNSLILFVCSASRKRYS